MSNFRADIGDRAAGIDRYRRRRRMQTFAKQALHRRQSISRSIPPSVKSFRLNRRRSATCSRVNTVYFWTSLEAGFDEIRRVLTPGGRAVIGFMPKEHMTRKNMPTDIFTLRTENDITSAIKKSQFSEVHVERPNAASPWAVVVAIR
jgi:hypothetical protein